MRIESIKIENYGSYVGKHEFKLSAQGLVLVVGDNQDEPNMDSNGSGKSTPFDALDWCLFGEVPRGDHVDSVINDYESQCSVEVVLGTDNAGQILEVRRSRERAKATKLLWVLDGQTKGALDVKETQRQLIQILGMDRQVFHASVLFGQEAVWQFAESTDAGRMEIATKVFALEDLDEMLARAKGKEKDLGQQVQNLETQLAALAGKMEGMAGQSYDVESAQWVEAWEKKLLDMDSWIQQADKQCAQIPGLEVELGQLGQQEHDLTRVENYPEETPYQAAIDEAKDAVREWRQMANQQLVEWQKVRDTIANIQQLEGTTCNSCNQSVTGAYVEEEVRRLSLQETSMATDAEAHKTSLARWAVELTQREGILAQFRVWVAGERARANEQAAGIRKQITRLTADHTDLVKTRGHLQRARADLAALQIAVNPWQAKAEAHAQELSAVQHEQTVCVTTKHKLEEERELWAFWVKGLGSKGLKSYILDTRLNELTTAANEWLTLLTGGTCWVRLETQALGRSTGKLSNKLTIRCYRWNVNGTITERNYRSWSGGEKKRIAWSLDFGLNQLIAARSTQSYNLMILDEVFKHVDRSGGEAVVEMLRGLRGSKDSIFVVEHDSAFQSQFDTRWVARKVSGRSHILEVVDEAQQERTA